MKQLFRCEYCSETGTEDEISEHEKTCLWNYDKRSCWTCQYAEAGFTTIKCTNGVNLEAGKYMEGCSKYKYNVKDHAKKSSFSNIFGGGFL